jgi:hypothetical protein
MRTEIHPATLTAPAQKRRHTSPARNSEPVPRDWAQPRADTAQTCVYACHAHSSCCHHTPCTRAGFCCGRRGQSHRTGDTPAKIRTRGVKREHRGKRNDEASLKTGRACTAATFTPLGEWGGTFLRRSWMQRADPSHSRHSSFFLPCLQMRAIALHFLHFDFGRLCSQMVGCGPRRALSTSACGIPAPTFCGSVGAGGLYWPENASYMRGRAGGGTGGPPGGGAGG